MSDQRLRGLPQDAELVDAVRVKPKPKRAAFAPPKLPPHRIVAWYPAPDASGEPTAAIVRQVNGETLNLAVFTKDGIRYMNTVRHIGDPRATVIGTNVANRQGVWTLMPDDGGRLIQEVSDKLYVLEERIQSLEEAVASILGGDIKDYRQLTGQIGLVDGPVAPTASAFEENDRLSEEADRSTRLRRVDGNLEGLVAELDGDELSGIDEEDDDDRS